MEINPLQRRIDASAIAPRPIWSDTQPKNGRVSPLVKRSMVSARGSAAAPQTSIFATPNSVAKLAICEMTISPDVDISVIITNISQKIGEASRQFEAVLLRQILSDSQKTVIPSELSDNSTAAGIYQDVITNTLADNISKSGAFGLAKTFTQQLNHPGHTPAKAAGATAVRSGHPLSADNLSVSSLRRTTTTPVKQP